MVTAGGRMVLITVELALVTVHVGIVETKKVKNKGDEVRYIAVVAKGVKEGIAMEVKVGIVVITEIAEDGSVVTTEMMKITAVLATGVKVCIAVVTT